MPKFSIHGSRAEEEITHPVSRLYGVFFLWNTPVSFLLWVFHHLNLIYSAHDSAVKNQIMIGGRHEAKPPCGDVYR
jgi:hypothetical protein